MRWEGFPYGPSHACDVFPVLEDLRVRVIDIGDRRARVRVNPLDHLTLPRN